MVSLWLVNVFNVGLFSVAVAGKCFSCRPWLVNVFYAGLFSVAVAGKCISCRSFFSCCGW
jgi:hypothetical protein